MLNDHIENKIYEMNRLNEFFGDLSPVELLFRTDEDFSIDHNYFIVDKMGDLHSFITKQEAEAYIDIEKERYKNHLNEIISTLKEIDEPGIVINFTNGQILEAGYRDALIYSLKEYENQSPIIIKLPKDVTFIKGLL